ncbi:MAG: hypothetical protein AAF957_12375 [Planctomycetota bacterium]
MARDVDPRHCSVCDEVTPHAQRLAGPWHVLRTRSLTRVSCERCRWRKVMNERRERRRHSPLAPGRTFDLF